MRWPFHTPGWQWPAPLSSVWPENGDYARTRTNKYTRSHKGPTTLCGTTLSLPSLPLRKGKKRDSPLEGHTETTIPQTLLFSSNCDQPNMFRIPLPGPGDTGELSRHEGQATKAAHPGTISTSWEILKPMFLQKACPRLFMQSSRRLLWRSKLLYSRTPNPQAECSYSTPLFPLVLQLHVNDMNSCAPLHHMNSN